MVSVESADKLAGKECSFAGKVVSSGNTCNALVLPRSLCWPSVKQLTKSSEEAKPVHQQSAIPAFTQAYARVHYMVLGLTGSGSSQPTARELARQKNQKARSAKSAIHVFNATKV